MAIDPNHMTLKRRSRELREVATACQEEDTKALLLFYAAECVLKAVYMLRFSLRSTAHENAAAKPARHYAHCLDDLLIALRVSPSDCPARPGSIRLRNGDAIAVSQLHEAWRYGERVENHGDVVLWLNRVIAYAEART